MNKILFLLLILASQVKLYSQQMAEYNLYHFNLAHINPAATGYKPCAIFNLTDRHQWTGIEGAPSIQSLSAQTSHQSNKYRKYAVGLNLVRDRNGATQNLGGDFSYAFHITLSRSYPHHLSFGLAAKAGQYSFDECDFTENLFDPAVSRGINTEWYFNASSGVFLYSEKYCAGLAVYNLIPQETRYYREYGNESFFITFIAGYQIRPARNNFIFRPSLYAARGNQYYQIDVNSSLYFNNGFWTGVTFRKYFGSFYHTSQNALVFIGYEKNSWNIAYAYDIGINWHHLRHLGSHQLSVNYTLCPGKTDCPAY